METRNGNGNGKWAPRHVANYRRSLSTILFWFSVLEEDEVGMDPVVIGVLLKVGLWK